MNVADTNGDRIDFGFTDRRAVQVGIGLNVHVAYVQTQGALVRDLPVGTSLQCKAPAVFEFEHPKTGGFLKEGGVVDAGADERLDLTFGWEVVVDRQGGRQLLGGAGKGAADVDVMLKRGCGQQLDAEVVADEVLSSQRDLSVVGEVAGYLNETLGSLHRRLFRV